MTAEMSLGDLAVKEAAWAFSQGFIRGVRETGAQKVYNRAVDAGHICQPDCHCLGCMDEGIMGNKTIGMAGSGILWGVEKTARVLEKNEITSITSHEYCAAAKVAAVKRWGEGQNPDVLARNADNLAQEFAIDTARLAGIQYGGHLGPDQLKRPTATHIANIVNYADVPVKVDFPGVPAFLVSKMKQNPKGALAEVELAVSIARGNHGFGDKIAYSPSPTLLVAMSNTPERANQLKGELLGLQAKLGQEVVAVDSVCLPGYNSFEHVA